MEGTEWVERAVKAMSGEREPDESDLDTLFRDVAEDGGEGDGGGDETLGREGEEDVLEGRKSGQSHVRGTRAGCEKKRAHDDIRIK